MQQGPDTETIRRTMGNVFQWAGWTGCIGIFAYATLEYDPNHGHFAPQWVGFAFILAIGLGITGTLVRSRMRLTRTIVGAFERGRASSREDTDTRVNEIIEEQEKVLARLDTYVRIAEVRADVAQRQQEILDRLNGLGK